MRPTRTPPPALPLAVLAGLPLLSGCFDEELDPVDGLLEAIGPELPEGVSAGPGGSIVIDKGLEAGGDPLASEGGGFECEDIDDCWDKCESHCFCKPRENGYCCCNTGAGELNCDHCEAGGDCGGEGGGRDIGLECRGATRGSHGSCRVYRTTIDPDSLRFDWKLESGRTAVGSSYSATGRSGMTWGGIATETRTVVLEVRREGGPQHGQRVWRGSATAEVGARNWRLQTQSASPRWVNSISEWPNAWGIYTGGELNRYQLSVSRGTGPWAGSYYLAGTPSLSRADMKLHNDLRSGGPAYAIPAGDTICGLSNVLRGVHVLNTTCKTVGVLNGFRELVEAHEYKHQDSLNDCIRVVNRRWMGHVEEAVGGQDHVDDVLEHTWYQVAEDLAAAVVTLQDPFGSHGDAHWYYGGWRYKPLTGTGHSGGQNGC
ncbi:MAG: hypothetical protein OXG58_02295 [Gemmatimonadetes bacterium]|nr:hypothetical protein [Gemmatimonadota bacterium]MCY3942548.1 hypothetical protein [Gemmatimonadota bacterium]